MECEIIDPLGKDYRNYVIPIRKEVFLSEGFTQEDDLMIMNPLDGLAYHVLYLNQKGIPVGTISVIDTKGVEEEVLQSRGIEGDLGNVAMVGKFAILEDQRQKLTGIKLAHEAIKSIKGFDYVIAEVSPPFNHPNRIAKRQKLIQQYSSIFGFETINEYKYKKTLPVQILGKKIN